MAVLPDNSVTTDMIQNSAITTAKLAGECVTNGKIAFNAIDGGQIMEGQIDTEHLINKAVTTDKLATSAVTTEKIKPNAIDSSRLAAGSVTYLKLASNSVITPKIEDGAVTEAKIANGSITTNKLKKKQWSNTEVETNELWIGGLPIYERDFAFLIGGEAPEFYEKSVSISSIIGIQDFTTVDISVQGSYASWNNGSNTVYTGGIEFLNVKAHGTYISFSRDGGLTADEAPIAIWGKIKYVKSISSNLDAFLTYN